MLKLWNQDLTHRYEAFITNQTICYVLPGNKYVPSNVTRRWMKCQKKQINLQYTKYSCEYMLSGICRLMQSCWHRQDLPSQDAIQIANNISDLGQIYNREDMDTSNPVSVDRRYCNCSFLECYRNLFLCAFLTRFSTLQIIHNTKKCPETNWLIFWNRQGAKYLEKMECVYTVWFFQVLFPFCG